MALPPELDPRDPNYPGDVGSDLPEPPPDIDWARLLGYLAYPPSARSLNAVTSQRPELRINGAVKAGDKIPLVYGKRLVEGKVLWKWNDFGSWIVMVGVCAGPIQAIDEIRINGGLVGASASPIEYTVHLGGYTQSVDATIAAFQGSKRYPGLAYVVFRISDPVTFDSIDSFSFLVRGRNDVYDPRGGGSTGYHTNPALCTRHFLTDTVVGQRIPTARMNDTSWGAAADACDALVGTPAAKKYEMNLAISQAGDPMDHINQMRSCFAAEIYLDEGLYCCVVDDVQTTPLVVFDTTNSWDVKIHEIPLSERPDRVIVKFEDAANGYAPATARAESTTSLRETTLPLDGCTSATQANRLAQYRLKRANATMYRFSWKAAYVGILLTRGCLVTLTSAQGLVAQEIIVEDYQPLEDGTWSCVGRQYADAVYDDEPYTEPTPLSTSLVSPWDTPPDVDLIDVAAASPVTGDDLRYVYWLFPRLYSTALWGASSWSQLNLSSFTASAMNDGSTAATCAVFNNGGTAYVTLDLGSAQPLVKVVMTYGTFSGAPGWDVQYSDNGSSFSSISRVFQRNDGVSKWTVAWSESVGSHRYWRFVHSTTAQTTTWEEWQPHIYTGPYPLLKKYIVRAGSDPTAPIIGELETTPEIGAPFDAESAMTWGQTVSGGYVTDAITLHITVENSVGRQSAGQYFATNLAWPADRVIVQSGTPNRQTGSTAVAGTAEAAIQRSDRIESPGVSAPAVSPSGEGRIYFDSTSKKYMVSMDGGAYFALGSAREPGEIIAYGGSAAPSGWVLCDGTSYVRTGAYAALFAAIGTTYGAADGSHFNVPDLRQRFPLGKAASGTGSTLGGTGGAIDHTHNVDVANTTASAPTNIDDVDQNLDGAFRSVATSTHVHTVNPASVASDANNPPFVVVNYLIKL